MQNRYAGDVGDFGKIGMLRCIEQSGITVGVNWYLVEDESHNLDGKHVEYLSDNKFVGLDEELRKALGSLIKNNNRSVHQLEKFKLLKSDMYYHEVLKGSSPKKAPTYQENIVEEIKGNRWKCMLCGYIYEGDELPLDFTCPICGQGYEAFEKID